MNRLTTGRKQYVEMNYGLSSGTEGEPSSSYRLAFCVELVAYSYNKKISRSKNRAFKNKTRLDWKGIDFCRCVVAITCNTKVIHCFVSDYILCIAWV